MVLAKEVVHRFGIVDQATEGATLLVPEEVARANVLATTVALPASAEFDAPAFNIATSIQRSVLELADSVGQVMVRKPELEFAPPRPGELFRSALDIGKAKAVLKWSPEWKFEDGLKPLVEWFQKEAR